MSDVIIYTTDDGVTRIELQLENGTVWLSQQQIAELFQTSKQNISKHIHAIFADQEVEERATVNQQLTVQNEGSRENCLFIWQLNYQYFIHSDVAHMLCVLGWAYYMPAYR